MGGWGDFGDGGAPVIQGREDMPVRDAECASGARRWQTFSSNTQVSASSTIPS